MPKIELPDPEQLVAFQLNEFTDLPHYRYLHENKRYVGYLVEIERENKRQHRKVAINGPGWHPGDWVYLRKINGIATIEDPIIDARDRLVYDQESDTILGKFSEIENSQWYVWDMFVTGPMEAGWDRRGRVVLRDPWKASISGSLRGYNYLKVAKGGRFNWELPHAKRFDTLDTEEKVRILTSMVLKFHGQDRHGSMPDNVLGMFNRLTGRHVRWDMQLAGNGLGELLIAEQQSLF